MSIQVSEHYAGEQGAAYAAGRKSTHDSPGHDINFRTFRPHISPDDFVLDFGCGNGSLLLRVKAHGARCEGLEINPAAASVAREAGFTVHPALDQIPSDRQYDVIISNHVLEHVRDPSLALEYLRGVLKPGGKLVLKVPVDDIRSRWQRSWSRDDFNHHLHTWSPRLLANTLFEAGYDVKECRVFTHAWEGRLLWCEKLGLGDLVFKLNAIIRNRRQIVAVATNPATEARDDKSGQG